jgi:CRISPR/Cas system-associated endonuclease Cas3-HD
MQTFIDEECKKINSTLEDYKVLRDNINLKYESSTTLRDALYTLRMRANEDQQKAIDALGESFREDTDMKSMVEKYEASKPALQTFYRDLEDSMAKMFRVYGELHLALGKNGPVKLRFVPDVENQLKRLTDSTPIPFENETSPYEGNTGGASLDGFTLQ